MNKKKSLLFVCYGLGIGGIEKCLVNLINVLPEERYDVDLLLMNPEYDMLDQIRRKIHLLDSFSYIYNTESTMQDMKHHGGLWKNREKLLPYFDHRVRIKLGLPLWTTFHPIEKRYDIAIAYSQNGLAPFYVMDKTNAGRKVLWYHNGAYDRQGKLRTLDNEYYPRFDFIVAVSHACKSVLLEHFPELADKILVLPNICDAKQVLDNALLFQPKGFGKDCVQIVTVGRMSEEKGPELALEACRILLARGWKLVWHWVGAGPLLDSIAKKRDHMGLKDSFILEGNQCNPYPYMQCADIYVQPSRYESYSMTVNEARILNKPMVITSVGGMRDQLQDGVTGWIVPIDAEAIAQGIEAFLKCPETMARFSQALAQRGENSANVLQEYENTVFQ